MQLSIYVAGQDVSNRALFDQTEIRRDSTDAISEATSVFYHADTESVYGAARLGSAVLAFRPREWQQIEHRDEGGGKQFAGFITGIKRESPPGELTTFTCTCADFGILLDRIVINKTWPTGWTDKNIILDAFADQSEVTVLSANIASIASDLGALDAKDITLRELLERICDLTGGEWRVDYDRNLHYYTSGTAAAPFAITDAVAGNHRMDAVNRDSSRLANRITVLGGFDTAGEISGTASNPESQARFGILSATVVDRQIADRSTADIRARAEVAQRAFPVESGKFTTWTDGLDVGQTVNIRNLAYAVNGDYLIRSVTIRQLADWCEYEVEFGQRQPDLVTELRRVMQRAKEPAYEPVALPAPGSVTVDNFASTIEPVRIVTSLPALPDNAYSDNSIVLLTTDRKLYRRSGNDWTRAVNAVDIVDQLQAGQLAADSVIAGCVAAGAIRATDAAFETAAIKMADIDLVSTQRLIVGTANILDAAVTNLKVASGLSASKMTTGTLDASQVTVINLNASNITTGTLSVDRLTAGTMTVAGVTIGIGSFGIQMSGFASFQCAGGNTVYGPATITMSGQVGISTTIPAGRPIIVQGGVVVGYV